jgi:hypothetical protein
VGVGEPVAEADSEGEELPLAAVPEGVPEALAQRERLEVGEALQLLLRLSLLLGVPEGVRLLLPVLLPVAVTLELWLALQLREEEPLGLTEGLAPRVRLAVALAVREELRLLLLLGVGAGLLLLL